MSFQSLFMHHLVIADVRNTKKLRRHLKEMSKTLSNVVIKGRTIRKVMGGGEGNFRAAGIFFRYQIPCMNFFQALA